MPTFRDLALVEYHWWVSDQANQKVQQQAALVALAQQKLVPLFTDHASKLVLDPTKTTTALFVDMENRIVVLRVDDGSLLHFAVYPDDGVYMTKPSPDGTWPKGPSVNDLDDIGALVEKGLY